VLNTREGYAPARISMFRYSQLPGSSGLKKEPPLHVDMITTGGLGFSSLWQHRVLSSLRSCRTLSSFMHHEPQHFIPSDLEKSGFQAARTLAPFCFLHCIMEVGR